MRTGATVAGRVWPCPASSPSRTYRCSFARLGRSSEPTWMRLSPMGRMRRRTFVMSSVSERTLTELRRMGRLLQASGPAASINQKALVHIILAANLEHGSTSCASVRKCLFWFKRLYGEAGKGAFRTACKTTANCRVSGSVQEQIGLCACIDVCRIAREWLWMHYTNSCPA